MSEQKRFVVKVYDRETGGEYEFDGDSFEPHAEKGVTYGEEAIEPNGHLRYVFKLWEGFEKWDDFRTDTK